MLTIAPQQQGGPSGAQAGGGNPTRVVVQTTDLSGTDEERHMRLTLQQSFGSVECNTAQVGMIKSLVALTGEEHSSALRAAVNSTGDDLKRLCTSEMDVEKALQGKPLPFPPAIGMPSGHTLTPLARAARCSHPSRWLWEPRPHRLASRAARSATPSSTCIRARDHARHSAERAARPLRTPEQDRAPPPHARAQLAPLPSHAYERVCPQSRFGVGA